MGEEGTREGADPFSQNSSGVSGGQAGECDVAFTESWVFGQENQPSFGLSYVPPGPDCIPFPQERLAVLDSQAGQIRAQAVQESERLARDKNAALQLLQKVSGLGSRERHGVVEGEKAGVGLPAQERGGGGGDPLSCSCGSDPAVLASRRKRN